MRNEQLRIIIKQSGIKMWEIAEKLNISDGNFSRKLRKELSAEETEKIIFIIGEIGKEKENEC